MANPEHVEVLKQGVEAWNDWRDSSEGIELDLNHANLVGMDLRHTNLSNVNLIHTDLSWANLSYVNLTEATLSHANLRNADLSRANLSSTNLNNANLSYVNFYKANLSSAILKDADLSDSDFYDADLSNTDMVNADLRRTKLIGAFISDADLSNADLTDADLSNAYINASDLSDVKLSWAKLIGTDIRQSYLGGTTFYLSTIHNTVFADIDLSTAKNLENANVYGKSTIGIDTIFKSEGKIPVTFLRRCGIPEIFIQQMDSLTEKPDKFYSCFISYCHKDRRFARSLHDQLQARGIRCWLDEHQVLPGDDIYEQVDRGIRHWDKVLLCCSEDSLTSWWVNDEVEKALEKEQQLMKERGKQVLSIIPLNLDGHLFSKECMYSKGAALRKRLAADFTGWENDNDKFEEQFERVVKALQTSGARELAPESRL